MKFSVASFCASATAILALSGGTLHAQTATPAYSAQTGTGLTVNGTEHFLQQVTLANTAEPFIATQFTIVINVQTASTTNAAIAVYFYNNLNTSDTATDVLANATYLASFSSSVSTAVAQNSVATYTLPSFNLGSNPNLGVEVFYASDSTFSNYATGILNGRFTTTAPTTGSSTGYVWNDANLDGVFTGADKTTFNSPQANIRFTLTGVPEPGTYALCGAAGLVFGSLYLRRRSVRA